MRNFACYLKSLGIEMRFIPDDGDILEAYKTFRNKNFIVSIDVSGIDPFLGLRSYDVGDTRAYFGRDPEVETAVGAVNAERP